MDLNYSLNPLSGLHQAQTSACVASSEDYAICRQIMLRASKNYSTASKYLPAEKLPHVEALYALMRVGDDRIDVSHTGFGSPSEAIDDWEANYWQAFDRVSSSHPVMRAYLDTATTLRIHPTLLPDFLDFNDFMQLAEAVVDEHGLDGVIQIASFYPRFQFEGTAPDDMGNFTNRAPSPTLHLLREASIERAVAAFPEAETIYQRNIETLKALGHAGWDALWVAPPK